MLLKRVPPFSVLHLRHLLTSAGQGVTLCCEPPSSFTWKNGPEGGQGFSWSFPDKIVHIWIRGDRTCEIWTQCLCLTRWLDSGTAVEAVSEVSAGASQTWQNLVWMSAKDFGLVVCSSVRYWHRDGIAGKQPTRCTVTLLFLKQTRGSHSCSTPQVPTRGRLWFSALAAFPARKVKLRSLGTSYFNPCLPRWLFSSVVVAVLQRCSGSLRFARRCFLPTKKIGQTTIRRACPFATLPCCQGTSVGGGPCEENHMLIQFLSSARC